MDNVQPVSRRRDLAIGAVVSVAALVVYVRTLAPSVAYIFDDTLEFQYVIPRLGIVHQTGYPLYTLLGKLFTLAVPLNDPAFRLNLLSAIFAALAAGMIYLVLRHLTQFRLAAIAGALTFAVGPTFWAQAVVAEVYALQMLLLAITLYLLLVWKEETIRGNGVGARRRFYLLAFAMGVGLTHHRLILLVYPAIAVYILLVNRSILRNWRMLVRAAILFVLPLSVYLYLPLRGAVGSANGQYQNTLQGFWSWVTALDYVAFITQDPLHVQYDTAFFWKLFQNEFGITGLALAAVGIVWSLRSAKQEVSAGTREAALLLLAVIIQAIFVFNYRVSDIQVHFLTMFALIALFIGIGADALYKLTSNRRLPLSRLAALLVTILLALIPLDLLVSNYASNDLSTKWDVYDYGVDILNQPLEQNATIIGLQGEITLIRYFQETGGLRPDIQTIAADEDKVRLAAVDQAIAQNRVVYLTRLLKGAESKYTLASTGPLIRLQSKSTPDSLTISHPLDFDFGPSIRLLGYDLDSSRLSAVAGRWHVENGRELRVTLYWQAGEQLRTDTTVSLKLLGKDGRIVGQVDRKPVLGAFPTTAWRPGVVVTDTYAVPVFLGAPPGTYTIQVTLYESDTGNVIGQRDLEPVSLLADTTAPRLDVWNIAHTADVDFGAFSLAGYSIGSSGPFRPGDALPLTLLWRAGPAPVPNSVVMRVWLEDEAGHAATTRDAALGGGFPVSLWQPNQYVRDWPLVRIPANVPDGKYLVKLAIARNNQLISYGGLPFGVTATQLGFVQVKNRPRNMTPPSVPMPLEETFGNKIHLMGYALEQNVAERGVHLTLYWKSLAQMDTSYTVFVHLIDGKGSVIASADSVPGGDLLTTGWIENEYIIDEHGFTLPPDLPEGGYQIEIGIYDPLTGTRLKDDDGQDRLILGSVNVP